MEICRRIFPFCLLLVVLSLVCPICVAQDVAPPSARDGHFRIEVQFPASLSKQPLDGRLIVAISNDNTKEPRFQVVEEEAESQQFFGIDVDGIAPGAIAAIDGTSIGYPLKSINELPAGDYYVQAVLNIYQTFHRADGHTVKLPPEMGEGQQWNRKPGNLYSKPQLVHFDGKTRSLNITMSEKIAAVEAPKDTKYVKHFRIQSKLLSDFWGVPVYLGAIVVLPFGFDEHPNAHYPLLLEHSHFPADFTGFRSEPPSADLKDKERVRASLAYKTYQDWSSGRLPHVILLEVQHANPYYDDSYAVNSENLGPYGDAINKELIPEVERRFRGIGQGWARGLVGGSTGGWESLATQVFYPDNYNGAWCFCPDPVDFRAYQSVNIYQDKNAFWSEGPWGKVPKPEMRDTNGNVKATMEPAVRREEVMGSHGRSTEQFGIWQAVFSPVGKDGYPQPIWNPKTGVIDSAVAAYWKEHYDLNHIMQRDWATLGPKLVGKLHITVGDMDTWYLNNAVHLMQDFLESEANHYRVAEFGYGYMKPHCYTGGGNGPVLETSSTWMQRVLPQFEKHIRETAPAGADMSWVY